jgi:hypothetical protein
METRQSAATRPDLSTSHCFYIVQGNAAATPAYVRRAANELVTLTKYFCGGHDRTVAPT